MDHLVAKHNIRKEKVKGFMVWAIDDSSIVAVPNKHRMDIIDVAKGEWLCQVSRKEFRYALVQHVRAQSI